MRLALSQGVKPVNFAKGALLAARVQFGNESEAIKKGLAELWQQDISSGEASVLLDLILNAGI